MNNLNKLIFRLSPTYFKLKKLKRLRQELKGIVDLQKPGRMKPYEEFLKSLYDFALKLPVGFVEDFSILSRTKRKVIFKSSQRMVEVLYWVRESNYAFMLDQGLWSNGVKTVPTLDYYSNPQSVEDILELMPEFVGDYIITTLAEYGKLSPEELVLVERFDDRYIHFLNSECFTALITDYIQLLDLTLILNSGGNNLNEYEN